MNKKDVVAIEEAYLSMKKKINSVPSDDIDVSTDPNIDVHTGPMDGPAPGTDMSPSLDAPVDAEDTTGIPVDMEPAPVMPAGDASPACSCGASDCDCDEAHQMSIENLSSIRDSVLKIAAKCASGESIEAWAHQKLAIAMDNLAEVARRC
jgi:hypothetical protein